MFHVGDISLKLSKTVDVTCQVVFGDTGLPAPYAQVQMSRMKTTDENGMAVLKLAPGVYNVQYLLPPLGTPYMQTDLNQEIVVTREPNKEPFILKLTPACTIEVTIVDADSGEPIPDADLWTYKKEFDKIRTQVLFGSWKEPVVHWQSPKSNKQGKLRVLVEPGTHRFGVGLHFRPEGYMLEETELVVDCPASKTIEVTFKLNREFTRKPK